VRKNTISQLSLMGMILLTVVLTSPTVFMPVKTVQAAKLMPQYYQCTGKRRAVVEDPPDNGDVKGHPGGEWTVCDRGSAGIFMIWNSYSNTEGSIVMKMNQAKAPYFEVFFTFPSDGYNCDTWFNNKNNQVTLYWTKT
jgi:hypothetical protein